MMGLIDSMMDLIDSVYDWQLQILILVVTIVIIGLYKLISFVQAINKIEADSLQYGGQLVVHVLRCHGVKNIFTLVGGHISPILVAAEYTGMKVVDTRHEATAVFAADAAARLTGNVGVAVVTAGPGVTNTVTAVKNAQMAESPVLLIGGAAATVLKGRGALQDIDQMSLFKTVCKHCERVKNLRQIVPALRRAINIALSGVPGPVFVEIPIDILYPYHVVRRQMLGLQRPTSLLSRMLSWFLECYLSYIFYSAWEPRDMSPLPVEVVLPQPSLVDKAAKLLASARYPLLLIGSQAMLRPDEVDQLKKAVKKLGIPTYLGGMARGLLGAKSFIQVRHGRREALKKADFVLLAGAVCDFRLEYGQSLPKQAVIVSVNRDYYKATMNAGTFWKPNLVVVGDVATFLVALSSSLVKFRRSSSWLGRLRDKDASRDRVNLELSRQLYGDLLNPLHVLFELERILPDNAILVADGGDFVGCASYILRPRGPLQWLDPGPFGTLGVGGGFALGAQITFPDAQVWIIYGDGSCGYSIAEFDTFNRHNLSILAVVGNDAGWTQIEREQKPIFGSSVACLLEHTNYHIVARGYGAEGILCGCLGDIPLCPADAFDAALELHATGSNVLINAWIGKTKFRDGSISV